MAKVGKYAVLATIDKRELVFPLLNIKTPVQEAMDVVEKELSIPIPAIVGQKYWREERTANINAAVKSLVEAINAARDRQNEGVRTSENNALKAENTSVKERISQLDENAVKRVTAEKDEIIESLKGKLNAVNEELANVGEDYRALILKYKYLVLQWNEMK